MKINCIIFDCDGTLVDSEYLGHLALETQLREIGVEESASKLMAKHRGGKLGDIILTLEKKHGITLDDDFILPFRKRLEMLFANELKEIDGITLVLEALEKIESPICVASGGPVAKIEQSLSLTNLKRFFGENIFSSYEVNSWKPDPELFLHAARAMNVQPKQCVVIEDSPIGVKAALAANMTPVFYNPMGFDVPEGVISIKHMRELPSRIIF
jgi:HAD superfamily hydrolase (TIGR01509 family)